MATEEATKNLITLKGSAHIIAEYLKFGINSILFQRGIYPPESFTSTQQYGLTIWMSTDKKIEKFLSHVLEQTEEWICKNEILKISMVITNASTKEPLESWEFKIDADVTEKNKENSTGNAEPVASKDLKRIQKEISEVMRQICATVSYLPLLECVCSFDVFVYTRITNEVPDDWLERTEVNIQNAQSVALRSYSTGLHKVGTIVNYKLP